MTLLRYLLIFAGFGLIVGALSIIVWDLYLVFKSKKQATGESLPPFQPAVRWRLAARLAILSLAPWLAGLTIAVVPSGSAGVRVNQFTGTRPQTLYPGVHLVVPMIETVELYPTRENVFTTSAVATPRRRMACGSRRERA
jgi:hypothetical protein